MRACYAFGAGVGIGTEICHVIGIEGCWDFTSSGDNGSASGRSRRVNGISKKSKRIRSGYGSVCAALQLGLSVRLGGGANNYHAVESPLHNSCLRDPLPTGVGAYVATGDAPYCKAYEGEYLHFRSEIAVHYAMANRELTYSATEDPELSHFEHEAPSKWSSNLAGQLEGEEGTAAARVGKRSPPRSKVLVCRTRTRRKWRSLPLVPSAPSGRNVLSNLKNSNSSPKSPNWIGMKRWSKSLKNSNQETREEESERIIEISPPVETTVTTGTDVELTTNPVEEDMPEFVPKPDPGEKGDEFKERKFALPIWLPHVTSSMTRPSIRAKGLKK